MKHRVFRWALILTFLTITVLAFAHEMSGWIAPEEAKKVKNPVKVTKTSFHKGKEIYEKKCALCHGIKGYGKGPTSARLNPKPASFRGSHEEKMTDGSISGKLGQGGGGCLPSQKI